MDVWASKIPQISQSQSDNKTHFLFMEYGQLASLTPVGVLPEMQRCEYSDIIRLLQNTKLKALRPLFNSWVAQRGMTIEQQLQGMCDDMPEEFTVFLHSSLHMATKKPLHLTHIVLVNFSFDFDLGKVARLENYELVILEKARSLARESLSGDEANRVLLDILNPEHSPTLLQSRIMRPHNQLLVVAFLNKPSKTLLMVPNMSELFPNTNRISAKKSDRDAAQNFQNSFPALQSPSLE